MNCNHIISAVRAYAKLWNCLHINVLYDRGNIWHEHSIHMERRTWIRFQMGTEHIFRKNRASAKILFLTFIFSLWSIGRWLAWQGHFAQPCLWLYCRTLGTKGLWDLGGPRKINRIDRKILIVNASCVTVHSLKYTMND